MGDDDLEILDEAPEHMKKKRVFIEVEDSDEEEERQAVAGPSRTSGRKREMSSSPEREAVAGPSRRRRDLFPGLHGRASSPEEEVTARRNLPAHRKAKKARFDVLIPHGEHDGPAVAGPSRARRPWQPPIPAVNPVPAREPTMTIAFGDEPEMEVPLGWGGLGIPARVPIPAVPPQPDPRPPNDNLLFNPQLPRFPFIPPTAAAAIPHPPAAPAPPALTSSIRPRLPADYLPAIREVIPDICPTWALTQLSAKVAAGNIDPAARVIQAAFEVDGGYPVVQKTVNGASEAAKKIVEDYRSMEFKKEERRGAVYDDKSQSLLNELLPMVPMPQYVLLLPHSKEIS